MSPPPQRPSRTGALFPYTTLFRSRRYDQLVFSSGAVLQKRPILRSDRSRYDFSEICHWFVSGYGAYGFKDHRWKYSGTLTYSFLKRDYVIWEYPKHFISATYRFDVMSPMDKFLYTDKDNIFLAWKTTTVDQMSYMRDIMVNYDLETHSGFGIKAMLRHREDEPTGNLKYWRNNSSDDKMPLPNQSPVPHITTAEASVTLRYAPGESFVKIGRAHV